jgi:hypothetical protein
MKRRVGLTLLLVLGLGLTAQHVRLETQDGGWLLNVYEAKLDLKGYAQDQLAQLQRLTHDCPAQADAATQAALLAAIQAYSPPDSASAKLVYAVTHNSLAWVEVWFDTLSPAVVILEPAQDGWRILPTGIWSGTTHPWRASPLIRQFLLDRNPHLSAEVLACWQVQHPLWAQ